MKSRSDERNTDRVGSAAAEAQMALLEQRTAASVKYSQLAETKEEHLSGLIHEASTEAGVASNRSRPGGDPAILRQLGHATCWRQEGGGGVHVLCDPRPSSIW